MNEINHVAIIMDGNGRWGLKKNRSRNYGHLHGIKTVETVIKSSLIKKIPHLTLYAFSTENWKRPDSEINFLFDLKRKSLKKKIKKIINQGIKVKPVAGRTIIFPSGWTHAHKSHPATDENRLIMQGWWSFEQGGTDPLFEKLRFSNWMK